MDERGSRRNEPRGARRPEARPRPRAAREPRPEAARPSRPPRRRRPVPRRHVGAIDGIRALCALAVVGYHMGLPWMSGGLLGVTVLFVLAGYFATDGLVSEYARTGTVSLPSYWGKRLRRLMPQAVACVVVTGLLCTLFNHELLTKMRPDVIPALLMVVNWSKILTKVSYFAAAGAPSPLTHYWSLAIEWQFYLVWPPILLLLMKARVRKRHVRIGLLVAALVSALLMARMYVPGADPSRAYYGTDTRAMSLLLGCWLALRLPLRRTSAVTLEPGDPRRTRANLVAGGSVAALLVLMVVTEGYTSFSYYGGVALVSVLAAAALAALLPSGTVVSRVLGCKPLVWLGQRSYALYLWHYPIVQLLTNRNSTVATPWWMYLLMLGLSLAAAELSYRFVEKPLGQPGGLGLWVRRGAVAVVPVVAVAAIAVGGLLLMPPVQAAGGKPGEERVSAATLRKPLADGVADVTIIGDSVPLDAQPQIAEVFPYALIDCKIGRQMSVGTKLLAQHVADGKVGGTVISCLGSNGPIDEDTLQGFMDAAGEGREVWFVNNRMPDDFQDANNQAIADFCDANEHAHLIDWHGYSSGHDDWFWQDGEHVTPDGAEAYAKMLGDALDYETPTSENTTYSVLVVGDVVPMGATDELAAAFPTGAVDCAEGRGLASARKSVAGYLKQGVVGPRVVLALGSEGTLGREELEALIGDLEEQGSAAGAADSGAAGSGSDTAGSASTGSDTAGSGSDTAGSASTGSEGPRTIYLVNDRTNGPWQDQNNKLLSEVAAAHENVQVIDWYGASSGHDDYFSSDVTDLSEKGAKAYAALIKTAVGGESGTEAS